MFDFLSKSFFICINNIRKWSTNPRIYILIILIVILVWNYVSPIMLFSKSVGYRIAPWIFPFMSNYEILQMLMMLGIVFLFCDAPFIDAGQPYLLVRSGRISWGIGQVFYIMLSTAIYFLFIVFLSILIISPTMFLSQGWGKVLSTLSQTNAANSFGILLPISYQIQTSYTPIHAFFLSLLLEWCAGTIVGLIIFVTNIYFKRSVGAIVASAVVLMDITIVNSFSSYLNHFSPVSMARLTIIDPSGISLRPTNQYVYIFFTVTIIILSIISVQSIRKREIHVLPQI